MNRKINNSQTSIKHVTAAAIGDTWWWWIVKNFRSGRELNIVSLHRPRWGYEQPTRAWQVDGEATSRKAPGNVHADGGGAARVGDVPHVIYFFVFHGVLLSLCRIVRVQNTTPQPPPPNWVSLGHAHARQRRGISRERNFMFIIPWSGGEGGAYIYRSIYGTLPLAICPLGTSDQWWMAVRVAFSLVEAFSWTAATLPPAKWWKYKGLGLNWRW